MARLPVHALPIAPGTRRIGHLFVTVRDMAKYDAGVDRHTFLGEAKQARAWTPFLFERQPDDLAGPRLVRHLSHRRGQVLAFRRS